MGPKRSSIVDFEQPEVVDASSPPIDLEMMNEYFYGVRVFPGQDPKMVYIGWVTTQYHIHSNEFSEDIIRTVTIQKLDNYGRIEQRYEVK